MVAVCTGHTDSCTRGFIHPRALEVLTIFCTSAAPVYVLVRCTDLRDDWGCQLARVSVAHSAAMEGCIANC